MSTSSTSSSTTTTTVPLGCGDGQVVPPEECDDGNAAAGDGCAANCALEDEGGLCAGVDQALGTAIKSILITDALDQPVDIQAPPLDPNHLFVVEQGGRIRVLENDVLLDDIFLDISSIVSCCGEQGLLGLAFHPDYENNRRFFVNYINLDGDTVVARYERSANNPLAADPASAEILLTVTQTRENHNGGQIAFDSDGYLYVGFGDGGGFSGRGFSQDDNLALGKLLRVDVDVEDPPYHAAPPDNPVTSNGDIRDLIWAKGLRNPWRYSFDRLTGDLYIADVGEGGREEVNVAPASSTGGENYGWGIFEGTECLNPPCPDPPDGFTMPVFEYDHGSGCSITGGYVYRGCAVPDLSGTYFYTDFCVTGVRSFELVGGQVTNQLDRTAELNPGGGILIQQVSTFGEDARGEIYIATVYTGRLFKIVPDE